MTKKETEMIFLIMFFSLLIVGFMMLSMQKNSKIQDLKHQLALTKLEQKQKCNERFLGIGNETNN